MLVLGYVGLILLLYRLAPRQPGFVAVPADLRGLSGKEAPPLVSIIVPARDEERNLPALLTSLALLDYPSLEVIVVDDRSTDGTAAIADHYGVTVVRGVERPEGWAGKQWACHQGAAVARGVVLLFTDADTVHEPDGLRAAVSFLGRSGASMISCLPWHDSKTLWERLLGPFHLLLLSVTAPYGVPAPKRVYAIGQYLMFTRAAYDRVGGHAAVKSQWVEDLPLANACLRAGMRYRTMHGPRLFKVRMYETLGDFVRGWRRNFRAGLGASSWLAPFEIAVMIAALTGGGQLGATIPSAILMALTMLVLLVRQEAIGRFSRWGPILFPFSVALFCLATALAVFDMVFKRSLLWKGRAYAPPPNFKAV